MLISVLTTLKNLFVYLFIENVEILHKILNCFHRNSFRPPLLKELFLNTDEINKHHIAGNIVCSCI